MAALNSELRNHLRHAISECRVLLEDDFRQQLEGIYGILRDGSAEPVEQLLHLDSSSIADRHAIEAALHHELNYDKNPAEAVERFIRESAFTFLNRITALKLMEHPSRRIVEGAVGSGRNSAGFKQFELISPNLVRQSEDGGYRIYLELLFGDLSQSLGALFDRALPQSIIFPTRATLSKVLELLNQRSLESVWAEDETLGWAYQYFTPKEQRDKAREDPSAPRNSYELAFLNQFYTPRYVVAFLSDNTLGKLWYEMRRGETKLITTCEYMLRPPDEPIFEREKRDPRTLRILDPACGSGHFLIYCFDLLRIIYKEAYGDPDLGPDLRSEFPDPAEYSTLIPRWILKNNLYGIDIDLRATQIASMALWLRAQSAWSEMGIASDERPTIQKTNIVCAEPMPGDQAMLGEFLRDMKPSIIGNLVRDVWEQMQLAGEAGSLLKVNEDLQESIETARKAWEKEPQAVQLDLLGGDQQPEAVQLALDISEITDESFWEEAEARVLEQLDRFARQAEGTDAIARSLFAYDAAQGFSLIDLLQEPFDVVLMNPPFGNLTAKSKSYIKSHFPHSSNNFAATFVDRAIEKVGENGYVAAIVDHATLVRSSYGNYRRNVLYGRSQLTSLVTLGWQVLDTANVETSMHISVKSEDRGRKSPIVCYSGESEAHKDDELARAVGDTNEGIESSSVFLIMQDRIETFPNAVPAFSVPDQLLSMFGLNPTLEPEFANVCTGLSSGDNGRFYKLYWEVPPEHIGRRNGWAFLNNGGTFSPFYRPWKMVIDWRENGQAIKSGEGGYIRNEKRYFNGGIAYGKRGRFLSAQFHPNDRIFTNEGQAIFPAKQEDLGVILGLLNSRLYRVLINTYCGQHKENGYVKLLPIPTLGKQTRRSLADGTFAATKLLREFYRWRIESAETQGLKLVDANGKGSSSFTQLVQMVTEAAYTVAAELDKLERSMNEALELALPLDSNSISYIDSESASMPSLGTLVLEDMEPDQLAAQLLDYLTGCAFGRWRLMDSLNPQHASGTFSALDALPMGPPGTTMAESAEKDQAHSVAGDAIKTDAMGASELGFMVDDPDASLDIIAGLEELIGIIWNGASIINVGEICDAIGYRNLRDYYRDSTSGFFSQHIARYSKGTRKAPIYWLLQSSSRNFGVWMYYHHLLPDTLFRIAREIVDPKLLLESQKLDDQRSQVESLTGISQTKAERELEIRAGLEEELEDFKSKLEAVAALELKPDLNDGVLLNIAPLHELVPWKEAAKAWDQLLGGKYEWSTIAKQLREHGLVKGS